MFFDIEIQKDQVKLSELLQYLIALKNKEIIQNYRIDEPSLEDVYINLTRNDENIENE